MKNTFFFILSLFILTLQSKAQDTTRADESTTEENVALITMTGTMIPLAIAGTVISIVPPSICLLTKGGINYGAMNFESGIGFGEKRETGVFSNWRVGVSYSHIFSSNVRDIFRTEVKRDFNFDFINSRKIFLSGFHISAGLFTNFPRDGYTIGTGAWIKSPWLSYFGFFPQHTIGVTYRYNKYFIGKDFHEISLCMTSSFTF